MKILLFGSEGQLGFEILKRTSDLHYQVAAPLMAELDIADGDAVLAAAKHYQPEIIINAAAYTAVDKAEEEVELSFKVNRDGAVNIARAAKDLDCRLVHISTDYVFEGKVEEPLREDAPTNPQGVYGASKLAAEQELQRILGDKVLILRTSALHGKNGNNFVHTMIKLFSERSVVKVVSDQIMSPTWAGWLAEAVLDLAPKDYSGIVHACSGGVASWYEFASEILKIVRSSIENAGSVELLPISTEEYPTPAKRPAFSVMNVSLLTELMGRPPISWQEGLREHLRELGYENGAE